MAKYTGNTLTRLGMDLLARAIASGELITFTKVEIGKGEYTGDLEEVTNLVESFKILPITSTTKLEGGSYRVRVAFSNSGVTEDTYLKEMGVFARGEDGREVLYSYCNTDTPDLIPAEGSGVLERVEDIITYISSATAINAVIDQSKIYATIKDLETKEDKFVKNSGFNLDKTDSVTSASSIILATAKAVKTAYDKAVSALNEANKKENKFNKNTAFNRNFGSGESEIPRGNHKHAIGDVQGCPMRIHQYFITEETSNPAVVWPGTTWVKLEDRVLIGAGGTLTLGSQGGRSNLILSLSNIPGHTHSFSGTTSTTGNHNHRSGNHRHRVDNHIHSQPSHTHSETYNPWTSSPNNGIDTGRGANFPSVTKSTGAAGGENTGGSAPYTDYQNPTTDTKGNHSHTVSGTTGSSGSGRGFDILNPYRAVNIWRRTA